MRRRRPLRLRAALMLLALLAGVTAAAGAGPVSAATSRRAVSPPPTGPEWAWIQALCADFLGHPPTPLNISSFQIGVGLADPPDVVRELANTPEAVTAVVKQMYVKILGRTGDPVGVAFWANEIEAAHGSLTDLFTAFYSSEEFFPGSGFISAVWFNQVTLFALGHPAYPGFVPDFVFAGDRAAFARAVVESGEGRGHRVDGLFRRILHRPADPSGLWYWASRITADGDIGVSVHLGSGLEYLNRAIAQYR